MSSPTPEYEAARKRAEAKIGFYIHTIVYVLVNAMLITLDLTGSPGKVWFYWPLFGWGIGLALHALKVFGNHGRGTPGWKERMIEREMAREQHEAS
jgi:hypothetical protein